MAVSGLWKEHSVTAEKSDIIFQTGEECGVSIREALHFPEFIYLLTGGGGRGRKRK